MPTSDHEQGQIEIVDDLSDGLCEDFDSNLFIGGDFNVAMNQSLNRTWYVQQQIPNSRFYSRLVQVLNQLDLFDVWRTQNPYKRTFTWSRSSKLARLYFCTTLIFRVDLISLPPPLTCPFSDHRLVRITLNPCDFERGRGYWRMKVSLIDREDVGLELTKFITNRLEQRWTSLRMYVGSTSS